MARFWLGTNEPAWLSRTDVPLFLSARRIRRRTALPLPAKGEWALDSGGFTEVSTHGKWTIPAEVYAGEALRWSRQIGGLAWAAPQDWMCEPPMLEKSGLSAREHQELTVENFITLRNLAPLGLGRFLEWGGPNTGGSIQTASWLAFIGASLDGYFRAIDMQTGAELWRQDRKSTRLNSSH